jgi:flagellar protein FlaJ
MRLNTKKQLTFPDLSVVSYRIFGKHIGFILPLVKDLDEDMKKAMMRTTIEKYASRMLFISLIGVVVTIGATLPILIRWLVPAYALAMSFALGIITGTFAFFIMYLYPSLVAGNRRRDIDKSLNFATQYMAILAGAEVTPEKIFKSMLTSDIDAVVKDEIGEVVKRIDIFGDDFYSALSARIKETPSKRFGDLMKGVLAVGSMGGDLRRYLHLQGKLFMRERKVDMKKQLEGLSITAEVYVSMGVVLPLILVIMLSTMSFIGGGGINSVLYMMLTTFVLIPVASMVMLVLIDMSVPREE